MTEIAKRLTKEAGVTKRLAKDVLADTKELQCERARLEKMRSENAEEGRLNIQANVIKDVEASIPANLTRLQKQIKAMEAVIQEAEALPTPPEKELEAAREAINLAKEIYEANKK